MAVYRFRVTFEDNEEIYREIEIKSTQNFEDFHKSILQSVNFENIHDASFFVSDDYWRKGDEIALNPIKDDDDSSKKNATVGQMSKCKIASVIDDPHQKFVYVYDPKTVWTFLVELLKIVPDDAKATYPKCAKTVGIAPKIDKAAIVPPVVLDDDELMDDEAHIDDEAYVHAHDEDEIAVLEGKEGDEEEVDILEEEGVEEETEMEGEEPSEDFFAED